MATDAVDTNIVLRCVLGDALAQRKKATEAEIKHREPLFTFDQKLAKQLAQVKLLKASGRLR